MLKNLIENPDVWDVAPCVSHDQPGGDDSDSEDGDDHVTAPDATEAVAVSSGQAAYNEFLSFLEAGCHGSPLQSYPVVVIVLSTLPSTVRQLGHFSLQFFLTHYRFCRTITKPSGSFLNLSGQHTLVTL